MQQQQQQQQQRPTYESGEMTACSLQEMAQQRFAGSSVVPASITCGLS
jgi:hypothetical protein